MLDLIDKVDRFVVRIGNGASILYFGVVTIAFYEVVTRYFFNSPTSWVHETTTFVVGLCLVYGGVHCYAADRHIAMVFIRDMLGPRGRWIVDLISHALILVFFVLMLIGAYDSAFDAFFRPNGDFRMQTSGTGLDTPFPAINKGFLFVCCVMLLVLGILHFIRHLSIVRSVFDGTYVPRPRVDEE
jgi:TRAP-type C4-dicarboxylate transport system permease small subunit